MRNNRRSQFSSIILHALLLMTVYVFQGMIFPYARFFGLVPLILPIVGTGAAVFRGRDAGGIVGLFAGIMTDLSFNEPVGLFTVLLTITGLVIGTLADTVLSRGFMSFYFCCLAVLLVCAAAQIFPLMLFEGVAPRPLLNTALRQTIYSMMFTFPLYFFVRALGKREH